MKIFRRLYLTAALFAFLTTWGVRPASARPGEYGRLRGEFKQLCELLKEDGRSDLVAKLVEPKLAKDKECPDCRPLFLQLYNPCRPPPPPKVKATPTPANDAPQPGEVAGENETSAVDTPLKPEQPQRFPQLAVLDLVSEISRQLADDERNPAQTTQAVDSLVKILTPPTLAPGERDYMGTLTGFLMSGFESDIIPPKVPKDKPSTKGLFGDEEDDTEPEAQSGVFR